MNLNFAEQLEQDCIAGQKTLATLFALNRADLLATVERVMRGKCDGSPFFFKHDVGHATIYRTTAEKASGVEPQQIRIEGFSSVEITFMGIDFIGEYSGRETVIKFDRYFSLGL
jgi:hypothetical protein